MVMETWKNISKLYVYKTSNDLVTLRVRHLLSKFALKHPGLILMVHTKIKKSHMNEDFIQSNTNYCEITF